MAEKFTVTNIKTSKYTHNDRDYLLNAVVIVSEKEAKELKKVGIFEVKPCSRSGKKSTKP